MGKKQNRGKRCIQTGDLIPEEQRSKKKKRHITTEGLARMGKIPTAPSDEERVANAEKADKQ